MTTVNIADQVIEIAGNGTEHKAEEDRHKKKIIIQIFNLMNLK